MTDTSYPHLLPQIRALADAPAEMRIRRISKMKSRVRRAGG